MTFDQPHPGSFFRAVAGRDALGRQRLGDVLVDAGALTTTQLATALARQDDRSRGRLRLGVLLVELGYAGEEAIAAALASQLELGTLHPQALPAPEVVRLLPRAVSRRSLTLTVGHTTQGLVVAMADPTDDMALDDVTLHTRVKHLTVLVTTPSRITEHLARAWSLGADDGPPVRLAPGDG